MSRPDGQVAELLAAADRDILTYRILRKEPSSPVETTLFHAQQALEKLVKAVLVGRGVVFPRTHDLFQLNDLMHKNALVSPVSGDLMVRLAPYAVEFRYLGVRAPAVALAESDRAIEVMRVWCEKEISK